MFKLDIDKLDLKNPLGFGSFGTVYPYQEPGQEEKWVVKHIVAQNIEALLLCFREIIIGFSCDHPCLVPVMGYSIIKRKNRDHDVYIKLPRMNGSLDVEWNSKRPHSIYYKEAQLVKYLYPLAVALNYFHEKRIFHRDIKRNNILLDYNGNTRLSDVGCSKYVAHNHSNELLSGIHGAEGYKPPELIMHEKRLNEDKEYKEKKETDYLKKESLQLIDSWSLGLTVLELCTLQTRFLNPAKATEEIESILQEKRTDTEETKEYGKAFLDLVFQLLNVDPQYRLKVSDLKTRLEQEFQEIITEEFKASINLSNEGKGEIEKKKIIQDLRQDLEEILKEFPEHKKVIQDLVKTLKGLFTNYSDIAKYLRTEEELIVSKEKMNKIILRLQQKWKDTFDIKSDKDCLFVEKKRDDITDQQLGDWVKDFIKSCHETDFNEDLIELEIILSECNDITDAGVKSLIEHIGGSLKDLQHFYLNLNDCWQITDLGVKSLGEEIGNNLRALQHLHLDFTQTENILD